MAEDRYQQLHAAFRWRVPEDFNIAEACCGRWARDTPEAPAIYFDSESGCRAQYSYGQLQRAANRLSNALLAQGVRRGHRVAIVLPQRFETAVAHIAIQQIGAVAMPLSLLFGAEALEYRLQDSGAVLAIAACEALAALREVKARCAALRRILVVGQCPVACDELPWMQALQAEEARFKPVATHADDPAILIYTSGTTGNPKGALIPQRALVGNLSGFVASQDWFGFDPFDPKQPSDAVFWSPADWAWTGGLMDALLPTLYFGRPIVAWQGRFSAAKAFELMAAYGVTHSFLFPTALKAMMKAEPHPKRHGLRLRALMSAGEAVGDAVFAWCRDALGVPVNEMFGQTEMNYVVGNCQALWPARPGSMGRAYPGHRVAVIDDEGRECAPGEVGEVAVHARDRHGQPDPVFFLGYWANEAATRAKFTGDADKVVNLITFYAQEVREILASIGARSLDEIIGRADLLAQVSRGSVFLDDLDLNPLLISVDAMQKITYDRSKPRNAVPDTLDAEIIKDGHRFFEDGEKMQLSYAVRNTLRTIGTRASSHIVKRFGMRNNLQADHLTVKLTGSCGQSLGAFAVRGLKLEVQGDANDYVGKGLSGGTIVVRPAMTSPLTACDNTIIGNTVLYGATDGYLYAAGRAGERFAVRNSGAKVVVEGCGSNGCEYMTGGVAVILGKIGANFGAGMTGGMAYLYDPEGTAEDVMNLETLVTCGLGHAHWEAQLRGLIETHLAETGSRLAERLLANWSEERRNFLQVCPKEMISRLPHPLSDEPVKVPAE
jgi:acetyl-CoA synthetase